MRLKDFFKNSGISAKITATYALCFLTLLCIINLAVWFGTSYALYEPAEKTLEYSMKSVQELLSRLEKDVASFDPNKVREPLVPGVVLRVIDDDGNIFIDTDPTYPSNELFEDCKMKDPPHFAKFVIVVIGFKTFRLTKFPAPIAIIIPSTSKKIRKFIMSSKICFIDVIVRKK